MNTVYTHSTIAGRGQVMGITQVKNGVELHITTQFGKTESGVEGHLYAMLDVKQCQVLSTHLVELARGKTLAITYQAEIVGVKSSPATHGDREKTASTLH